MMRSRCLFLCHDSLIVVFLLCSIQRRIGLGKHGVMLRHLKGKSPRSPLMDARRPTESCHVGRWQFRFGGRFHHEKNEGTIAINMKATVSSPKGKSLRSSLLEHTRRTQIEAMESRTSKRAESYRGDSC